MPLGGSRRATRAWPFRRETGIRAGLWSCMEMLIGIAKASGPAAENDMIRAGATKPPTGPLVICAPVPM